MKEPIPFTETEHFLIHYYRAPSVSGWRETLAYDGACLTISALFVAMTLAGKEETWAGIGYLMLFLRMAANIWQSRRWIPGFHGVITKYEARIAELTAELEKKESHG
jgi:hypothetical protein